MWIKQRGNQLGYKAILTIYKIIGYRGTKPIIWLEDIDEIIKILIIAKKLERISDNAKTIASYLLYAKEGIEI